MFPVIYFLFVTAKCLSYRGTWSLSHKHHTNSHMYYYKQTGNKTCYVRRKDEPQVLAEYKERQMWRQERKELRQQLMNLSPAERREALVMSWQGLLKSSASHRQTAHSALTLEY